MKKGEFEQALLQWWAKTRIPLTLANVQLLSGEPRKRVASWLDEMTAENILDVDADEAGNIVYSVVGAGRSPTGVTSYAEYVKLSELAHYVRGPAGSALVRPHPPADAGQKSVALAALLPLFFGPVGLFYSAPIAEALLALVFWGIAGTFLLPLAGVIHLALAALGIWYAHKHNETGERTPFLTSGRRQRALPPR